MKKIFSLFLSLVLVLGLTLPALASGSFSPYTTPDGLLTFQEARAQRKQVTLMVGDFANTVDATVITVRSGSAVTVHGSFLAEYQTGTGTADTYTQVSSGASFGPETGVTQVEQLLTYRGDRGLTLGVLTYSSYTGDTPAFYVVLADRNAGPAIPPSGTAYPQTYDVEVDGVPVRFHTYALKAPATGYLTNYVRIRDIALALRGSAVQFEVGWEGSSRAVTISSGLPYTANGSENATPFSGDRPYTVFSGETWVNGVPTAFEAISLTDDRGGGYTYYQLRDLGRILGFNVGYDNARRVIYVQSNQPYTG